MLGLIVDPVVQAIGSLEFESVSPQRVFLNADYPIMSALSLLAMVKPIMDEP